MQSEDACLCGYVGNAGAKNVLREIRDIKHDPERIPNANFKIRAMKQITSVQEMGILVKIIAV